jgi:ankyrin repeat protein
VGRGDIQGFNTENILPLPVADLVQIREWLQPTPYDEEKSEYRRHRASHLVGTGRWLTSTVAYQNWHHGDDNGIMWIKGIPGSGKSVMAASIIDQLSIEEVPVLHFFFRQIIDANHKPFAALRDFLCQVLDYSPPLQVKLKEYLEKRRSIDSLSPSDIWRDLKLALEAFPRAYCVTDALDEMDPGNEEFLHALVELGQWRPANMKVLITSRPVSIVETSLRSFTIPQIRLEERQVDLDIGAYVQYRLRNSSVPQEHRGIIEEAIPGRANGLFLYAKLSMDAFVEPGADVREVLKTLPADLNVMYTDLLRENARRSNVPDELQLLVLQFVTHATRPLRLLEIAEIMKRAHVPSRDSSLKSIKQLVRVACGPLLEILPDETVSVVHHSFTEFLKGFTRSDDSETSAYPILRPGPTNKCLAIACLDYLKSGCLDDYTIKDRKKNDDFWNPKKDDQIETRLQYPFLEYAAGNWHVHAHRAALAGAEMLPFYNIIDAFFATEQQFRAWLDFAWPDTQIEKVTSLHAAARTGLLGYVTYLLEKNQFDIEAQDDRMNTPLHWAATAGHADIVKHLIERGANLAAEEEDGLKPLHQAASRNHAEVVKLLLTAGVDPVTPKTRDIHRGWCGNAPTTYGQTPLMYACHNGHFKSMVEFIPFLKDPEVLQKALYWAADKGRADIVGLLLEETSVDVNGTYQRDTALFKACENKHQKTIEILLHAGADPNKLCRQSGDEFSSQSFMWFPPQPRDCEKPRGWTALHVICGGNDRFSRARDDDRALKCAEILLDAGADVHVQAPDGSTALHHACKHDTSVVKLLMEAGADPTAEDNSGNTPLHTEGQTDKELLPLLWGTGHVDINKRSQKGGKTPLHCRLGGFYDGDVMEFLKYKPDVNITSAEGDGPLHIYVNNVEQKTEVIEALVAAGADPNMKNRKGDTPLHTLGGGKGDVAVDLLNVGADIEARNNEGQTPLFRHIIPDRTRWRKAPIDQVLIDRGAKLDTRDYRGRTLLFQCFWKHKSFDKLIGLGLDPATTDYAGNTLFHEAVGDRTRFKHLGDLKRLSSLGLDIDQPNHAGRTPLHVACNKSENDSRERDEERTLDYILRVCKNVNPRDLEDILPVHLAAAVSEVYMVKLANARADLSGVTHEGMTVLHIAARARQPNIISLVLSRLGGVGEDEIKAFVNKENEAGATALHYACRSGRPESVKALLEAGADPNQLDKSGNCCFRAAVQFETEQKLWSEENGKKRTGAGLVAAGILIEDEERPYVRGGQDRNWNWRRSQLTSEHDTTRLEEIFDLLILHGARVTSDQEAFSKILFQNLSEEQQYTLDCLSQLGDRLLDLKMPSVVHSRDSYHLCNYRLEGTQKFWSERWVAASSETSGRSYPESEKQEFAMKLLRARQYSIFKKISPNLDLGHLDDSGKSILNRLVRWGYSDLLACTFNGEAASHYDDPEWCLAAERENTNLRAESRIQPLLPIACSRGLPNMDMVELLVEKIGVDINARQRGETWKTGSREVMMRGGALHGLAEGSKWWHVNKALPYLIKKGANTELRDEKGATPLHIALDHEKFLGPYRKEAVRFLVESGADVNAIDKEGNTCLSKAGKDLGLIKLLLDHGAKVEGRAIFSAINLDQIEILDLLLAKGDHANLRKAEHKMPKIEDCGNLQIIDSELLPLSFVARVSGACKFRDSEISKENRARIMQSLLNRGADPFASYVRHVRVPKDASPDEHDLVETDEQGQLWKLEKRTVIHDILESGNIVEPLFQLPDLDLERRDQRGCTLLLAAAQSKITLTTEIQCLNGEKTVTKTVFQEFVDRGANILAQDNDGKNILHHVWKQPDMTDVFEPMMPIIPSFPSLIQQRDHTGDTPMHYALRFGGFGKHLEFFIENGADPVEPDSEGNTALHHSARKQEFLKDDSFYGQFFKEHGAEPIEPGSEEEIALYRLARKQDPLEDNSIFKRFLDLGVDINARNSKGNTPLLEYIDKGFNPQAIWMCSINADEEFEDSCFRIFKNAGADFFAVNNAGSSLLHILAGKKVNLRLGRNDAAASEIVERFKVLMKMGLDPMAEDSRQRTSLDIAAACGGEHILKLFERKPME